MTAYPLGYEIACDGPGGGRDCPASAAVQPRPCTVTAAEVRADGREQGWTRPRRGGRRIDLCPDCRAEAGR